MCVGLMVNHEGLKIKKKMMCKKIDDLVKHRNVTKGQNESARQRFLQANFR